MKPSPARTQYTFIFKQDNKSQYTFILLAAIDEAVTCMHTNAPVTMHKNQDDTGKSLFIIICNSHEHKVSLASFKIMNFI